MTPLLGCIADDFTGGTDLAGMLVQHGMRTVQMIGVPHGLPPHDVDAIVVALKTRTSAVREAVAESLAALDWLRSAGCRQFLFKYCSTFDSTPRGNIGPVAEALMNALGADVTIACPAFPANRRTVFKGHLFVGNVPLHESGMRDHPLTPMTDANLVRVLQRQVKGRVGLIDYQIVASGAEAIGRRFDALRDEGAAVAIVDAVFERDLRAIGAACAELPLVTGGSGVAMGLPENFRRCGLLSTDVVVDALPPAHGYRAVVAGSCSVATQEQVAAMCARCPAFRVDPMETISARPISSSRRGAICRDRRDHPKPNAGLQARPVTV